MGTQGRREERGGDTGDTPSVNILRGRRGGDTGEEGGEGWGHRGGGRRGVGG